MRPEAAMGKDMVPPVLDSLTLLTTLRCNFACKHCGYRCGPQRKERMDEAEAKGWIRQGRAYRELKYVAFSGGEPFLYPKLLSRLVAYAGSLGLQSAVVTNASWASSEALAYRRLKSLQEDGLIDFTTSFDWFHLDFVSPDRICNAVYAALRLNLAVHVNVVVSRNGTFTLNDAIARLGLPDGTVLRGERAYSGAVAFKELSPIRVGAAEDHLADADLIRFDRRLLAGHGCASVISNPVVNPGGELYGCCGFGGGDDYGPSSLTYAGNLRQTSLEQLWKGMSRNLLLNLIRHHGPYRLIELVEERWPGTRTRKDYAFSCEVCHEIAARADLQQRIALVLEELVEEGAATV